MRTKGIGFGDAPFTGSIPPKSKIMKLPWFSLVILFLPSFARAGNAVVPRELVVEPPTLHCLGFEWPVAGDDNRNAVVEVSYRRDGDSAWKPALPLLRIGGERVGGVAGWPDYDGLAAKTIEWNGTNYAGLAEFSRATGLESRGVPVSGFDRFERVEPPDDRARTFQPGELDFRLRAGRIVVDAGCALPNVNDGFDGMAPDLGALERGRPAPHYGPRPRSQ